MKKIVLIIIVVCLHSIACAQDFNSTGTSHAKMSITKKSTEKEKDIIYKKTAGNVNDPTISKRIVETTDFLYKELMPFLVSTVKIIEK